MRTIKLFRLLAALALAGGLVGCGGAPVLPATPITTVTAPPVAGTTTPPAAGDTPVPATDTPAAPADVATATGTAGEEGSVVIGNTDAGRSIPLQVGQVLSVRLTDRRWSQPVVDPAILQLLPAPASIVANRWNYRAIAPGQTTLTTEGACVPNATGPACDSIVLYRVTITVTGAAPVATPAGGGGGAAGAWPPEANAAVANALQDLAGHAGVGLTDVRVVSVVEHEWPTPALGCAQAGRAYTQVITPGYIIVLAVGGSQTVYHAGRGGNVVTCGDATP